MEYACPANMCRLCKELAAAYDLEPTLQVLSRNIAVSVGAKACTVRLLDLKNMTLQIAAAYGLSDEYLKKGPVRLDEHPVDRRVLEGEVIATRDITAEPHVLYLEQAKREGIRSVLSMPLTVRDRNMGVVRVYTGEPRDFTGEEVETMKTLVSLGGILADRALLWKQKTALIDTARSISSTLSLKEVLDRIVERAANVLGFKASSIRLLDAERRTLRVESAYGLSERYLSKGPVEVEKSPVDLECLQGRIVEISDIAADRRLQYPGEVREEGIGALLSVPLPVRGTIIGVLRVYTSAPYRFTGPERDFLSALASQGATAIENARLFEHVHKEYEELTKDVWRWYDWGAHFPRI